MTRVVLTGGKGKKYHKKLHRSSKKSDMRKSKSMKKLHRSSKKGGMRKSKSIKKLHRSSKKDGSRKSKSMKKLHRSSKHGGMLHRAALPFGLLGLQKLLHSRKERKSLKKLGKKVLSAPAKTAKLFL